MCRRNLIKNLKIRQAHDPFRRLFMSVIREGLVAGEIFSGLHLFGKGHRRHISKQSSHRGCQLGQSGCRLCVLHEPAVFFLCLSRVTERLLDRTALTDIIVHIFKPAYHAQFSSGHIDSGKFDPEVPFAAVVHQAQVIDGKLRFFSQTAGNSFKLQLPLQPLPVLLGNDRMYIIFFCLRVFQLAERVPDRRPMDGISLCISPIQGKSLGFHILDEPHRMVGLTDRFDDRLSDRPVRLHALPFLRDIRDKDTVNPAISIGFRIMSIIIHPADRAIFTDDAVFHIVQVPFIFEDLFYDGFRDCRIVLRVQHTPKCKTGQRLKFFQIFAAENGKHRMIRVQQFFLSLCLINEKTSGHVSADLFHDGNRLLI